MSKELAAPQEQQIQLEIDDATSKGSYANLAFITHSETEFIMDFALLQPQGPKAKVTARVITSPAHMKRLIIALQDNVKKHEARFGTIKLEEQKTPGPQQYH